MSSSQNIKATFFDDADNWFYTSPLTDVTRKDMVEIGMGHLKGWHFFYDGQDWTTDVDQCGAGDAAVNCSVAVVPAYVGVENGC